MMISQELKVYGIEWRDYIRIMNCKGCVTKRSWKPLKTSDTIAGRLATIWTRDLLNSKQELLTTFGKKINKAVMKHSTFRTLSKNFKWYQTWNMYSTANVCVDRAWWGVWNFSQMLAKKLKLSHYTPRRRLGERRYSSYSLTTSELDGGEWSAWRPSRALGRGKGPPVPIVHEAGWASEPVWTQRLEEKSFAPAGDRTSIDRSSNP
jgi:hypothetical protein